MDVNIRNTKVYEFIDSVGLYFNSHMERVTVGLTYENKDIRRIHFEFRREDVAFPVSLASEMILSNSFIVDEQASILVSIVCQELDRENGTDKRITIRV